MSGPIIRKYGFPNFENIFGPRPLEHGAAEGDQSEKKGQSPESKSDPKGDEKASSDSGKAQSKR